MSSDPKHPVRSILIVGGGSAGWITAGLIASEHGSDAGGEVAVTLIESPEVKTIGVGEGTWPTMRTTLIKIGVSESEFLSACTAAFKQGTRFVGWVTGDEDDSYYHPFTAPAGYSGINLVPHWQPQRDKVSFVDAVSVQGYLCDRGLAPKQPITPEYAGVVNYAYHLDAGKFADLLQRHCTTKLGVRHIRDHVTGINADPDGDIRSVATAEHGDLSADLFVDCTGFAALLLGDHYGVRYLDKSHILFNDAALAVQVPYASEAIPIASQTIATAQSAGWIWDIGLTTRRGIGHVYSSAHTTDEAAEMALRRYIEATSGPSVEVPAPRKISFKPGHREKFWHRNCVAVGMAAGFLEPLEASALVLVELAGRMIAEQLPANRGVMDIIARRYNETFRYRWDRIIEFLKLHYVLSRRTDSDFWTDNRRPEGIPQSLRERLELWRYQVPWHRDFPHADEVFPSASYQYVLYGMGFATEPGAGSRRTKESEKAQRLFAENIKQANEMIPHLPRHRDLLARIGRDGLPAANLG